MQDKKIQVRVRDDETNTAVVASYDKMSEISDGYHTFAELYRYRMLYQAAWFNEIQLDHESEGYSNYGLCKSKLHHDGTMFEGGYFIVVAQLPTGQISNHYKLEHWDMFKLPEVEKAPEWDGHTPTEAADRIEQYISGNL